MLWIYHTTMYHFKQHQFAITFPIFPNYFSETELLFPTVSLLHRHTLSQIPRLVHIQPLRNRYIIPQQLKNTVSNMVGGITDSEAAKYGSVLGMYTVKSAVSSVSQLPQVVSPFNLEAFSFSLLFHNIFLQRNILFDAVICRILQIKSGRSRTSFCSA